jgi:hypothetical protein
MHGYKIEFARLCCNHNIFCIIFEFVRLVAITKFVALWMATQLILQDFVAITKFVALWVATQLILQDLLQSQSLLHYGWLHN